MFIKKIILFFIFLFAARIGFASAVKNIDFLKIENVKEFKTVDWNNDGKQDILVYFNDGRFGIFINNSKSIDELSFEPIRYIKLKVDNFDEMLKNSAVEDTAVKHLKKPEIETAKIKIPKIQQVYKDNKDTKNIELSAKKDGADSVVKITEKSDVSKTPSQISQGFIYDACILNFINETDISRASEAEWLKIGIPNLLAFELENFKNITIMPRDLSGKLMPGNPKINSRIVIYGSYKILENDIIITVFINDGKKIKQQKFAGKNNTDGFLTTISSVGIELAKQVSEILNLSK
ncbi:MAG TPA: hypothetical protein PLJ38_02020 [bacterium]|nr:hypothetical protein [bacterium]